MRLAQAGSLIIEYPTPAEAEGLASLIPDYVDAGGLLASRLVQEVINPAAQLVGPDGFSVVACDASGREFPSQVIAPNEDIRKKIGNVRAYALGEDREEFYVMAATGAAMRAVHESRAGQSRHIDQEPVGQATALEALDWAATIGLQVATDTLEAHPGASSIPSLYVRVRPHEQPTQSVSGVELFTGATAIFDRPLG
jgi:hypothetical protein